MTVSSTNFYSRKMYKIRFDKWNWKKYQDGTFMRAAHKRGLRPDRINKRTAFRKGSQLITEDEIARYMKRADEYQPKHQPPSPTLSMVDGIECSTPPQDNNNLSPTLKFTDASGSPERALAPRSLDRHRCVSQTSIQTRPLSTSANPLPMSNPRLFIPTEFSRYEELFKTMENFLLKAFDSRLWYSDRLTGFCQSQSSAAMPWRKRPWGKVLRNCLWDCFWAAEHGRPGTSIGHLAGACRLTEYALLEGDPHLSARVIRSLRHARGEMALQMRAFFLRYFCEYARESTSPHIYAHYAWASILLRNSSCPAVFSTLLRLHADIFQARLTALHYSCIVIRWNELCSRGRQCPIEEWEALHRIAQSLEKDNDIRIDINLALASRYFQQGNHEEAQRLLLGPTGTPIESVQSQKSGVWCLLLIARIHITFGRLQSAEKICTEVLEALSERLLGIQASIFCASELCNLFDDLRLPEGVAEAQSVLEGFEKECLDETERLLLAIPVEDPVEAVRNLNFAYSWDPVHIKDMLDRRSLQATRTSTVQLS